jgi:hypothetical protein
MKVLDRTPPELAVTPVPHCLLCGAAGVPLVSGSQDHLFGVPGSWSLSLCPGCGFGWLDPQPTRGDIGKAYERYYTHADEEAVLIAYKVGEHEQGLQGERSGSSE